MTPSSWITPKAAKGVDSTIAGRGLVATAPIGKDEVEIQITDDLHLAALADDEYEPVMLFINHSCDPNVGFAGNIVLVAMRDIKPGEELTTDYALFDDYDGSMPCQCGAPDCRAVITGHDWQRPDLQRKYRGYFSWYLQRRMSQLGTLASLPATAVMATSGMVIAIRCRMPALGDVVFGRKTTRATAVAIPLPSR
jgi:uncharacterized protein